MTKKEGKDYYVLKVQTNPDPGVNVLTAGTIETREFTNSTSIISMRMTAVPSGVSVSGSDTRRHRLMKRLKKELSIKIMELNK